MTGLARGKIVPRHQYGPTVGLRRPEFDGTKAKLAPRKVLKRAQALSEQEG